MSGVLFPDRVFWRGWTFTRGLDAGEYHCGDKGQVWWSDKNQTWIASLSFPGDKAKRDGSKPGSFGETPEAALDEEVRMWLRGVLALPGALDHAMIQSVLES